MPLIEYNGNIFNSKAQTLVNTVNCVGIMGKGIALEFRLRYPEMYATYKNICDKGDLHPGQILPYREKEPWVLSFAVKNDWKHPSKMEWVESCLKKFVSSYSNLGIKSIAFPWIGAMNGGLPWDDVHAMMRKYLQPIKDISIEIVEYNPLMADPIFTRIKNALFSVDTDEFARLVNISIHSAKIIEQAINVEKVPSLEKLKETPGLGKITIERLYACFREEIKIESYSQKNIFD